MSQSLDIERHEQLIGYLRATGRAGADQAITCRTLSGGVSNRAVWVDLSNGRAWVLKQALEKLRVKDEWLSDPARTTREAEGLRHLARLAPAGWITPLVFEDPAVHLLAMEAVPHPHENLKTVLLAAALPRERLLRLTGQLGTLLATIHRNAAMQAESVHPAFEDQSFFQSLRIDPYYRATAEREPEAAELFAGLIARMHSARLTLTHGDYSPKNVLVSPGGEQDDQEQLVLLDHEVIHWGDPAFDIGFAMAHLLSKAHHLVNRRGDFRDAAVRFWECYCKILLGNNGPRVLSWAPGLEPWCARHAIACLLARVSGKSPLEYLDDVQRGRQRAALLALLPDPPQTIPELADRFLFELQGIE